MFNITIFFTTIVFILNALLLYKILKNRKGNKKIMKTKQEKYGQ